MTDKYQIIITPDAEEELNNLDDYITYVLLNPKTAARYIHAIKEQLSSLCNNPRRYRIVDDEPWHSRGVRRMNAKGFAVFYLINEDFFLIVCHIRPSCSVTLVLFPSLSCHMLSFSIVCLFSALLYDMLLTNHVRPICKRTVRRIFFTFLTHYSQT